MNWYISSVRGRFHYLYRGLPPGGTPGAFLSIFCSSHLFFMAKTGPTHSIHIPQCSLATVGKHRMQQKRRRCVSRCPGTAGMRLLNSQFARNGEEHERTPFGIGAMDAETEAWHKSAHPLIISSDRRRNTHSRAWAASFTGRSPTQHFPEKAAEICSSSVVNTFLKPSSHLH